MPGARASQPKTQHLLKKFHMRALRNVTDATHATVAPFSDPNLEAGSVIARAEYGRADTNMRGPLGDGQFKIRAHPHRQ